ncbi:uncharacterized [Tachysurus ichikawai]
MRRIEVDGKPTILNHLAEQSSHNQEEGPGAKREKTQFGSLIQWRGKDKSGQQKVNSDEGLMPKKSSCSIVSTYTELSETGRNDVKENNQMIDGVATEKTIT